MQLTQLGVRIDELLHNRMPHVDTAYTLHVDPYGSLAPPEALNDSYAFRQRSILARVDVLRQVLRPYTVIGESVARDCRPSAVIDMGIAALITRSTILLYFA
jgi:hypothetical protein